MALLRAWQSTQRPGSGRGRGRGPQHQPQRGPTQNTATVHCSGGREICLPGDAKQPTLLSSLGASCDEGHFSQNAMALIKRCFPHCRGLPAEPRLLRAQCPPVLKCGAPDSRTFSGSLNSCKHYYKNKPEISCSHLGPELAVLSKSLSSCLTISAGDI